MNRRARLALMSVLAGLALYHIPVAAQTVDATEAAKGAKTPKNVDIEADTMEILDEQKKAVFKGNVSAVRADVTLKCDTLIVSYTETAATPAAKQDSGAQQAADTGTQDAGGDKKTEVTFLDAEGNVMIITDRQ